MPQSTAISRYMIPPPLSRYIRYWYTYRTAVAVLIALVLSGSMYWLYTQQLTCDAHATGCLVNISVHPEDRFANQYDPGKPMDGVTIVGIDNSSIQALQKYPLPRHLYADALRNLEKAGALVVAFDIGFADPSGEEDKT
ncbi:MAG: CHASE2 domain-containing protein, partial [Chloroflexi bacterium]